MSESIEGYVNLATLHESLEKGKDVSEKLDERKKGTETNKRLPQTPNARFSQEKSIRQKNKLNLGNTQRITYIS